MLSPLFLTTATKWESTFLILCLKKYVGFLEKILEICFQLLHYWMLCHLWHVLVIKTNEYLLVLNPVIMDHEEKPLILIIFSWVYWVAVIENEGNILINITCICFYIFLVKSNYFFKYPNNTINCIMYIINFLKHSLYYTYDLLYT